MSDNMIGLETWQLYQIVLINDIIAISQIWKCIW